MFLRTLIAAEQGELTQRVSASLAELGGATRTTDSVPDLREKLDQEPFDLVVLDRACVPGVSSRLITELRALDDAPHLIVLLDKEDASLRAELLAAGAYGVLHRELPERLFQEALVALARRCLSETRARLRAVPDEDYRLSDYATRSEAMLKLLASARRVASRDTTLLLLGETGVGKGLLARAIHNEGPRASEPFIAMNCGALTESLLEAELFGHERGAFTGASRARRGFFELAHQGTIFLDEIGDMPLHLQVKLLQVLEERRVRPVGSEKVIEIDVRLIAATNRDLAEEVAQDRFREDLFYRLNVMDLTLPPLRERTEDIPEIAQGYVEHFRALTGSDARSIAPAALEALIGYAWPGNIRELANAIERAEIMSLGKELQLGDFPLDVQTMGPPATSGAREPEYPSLDPAWLDMPWSEVRRAVVEDAERQYLIGLLKATQGRIGETATRGGMDPRSLHEKMKRYGLRKEDFRPS